jgi:predicted nucleotidyltransferase
MFLIAEGRRARRSAKGPDRAASHVIVLRQLSGSALCDHSHFSPDRRTHYYHMKSPGGSPLHLHGLNIPEDKIAEFCRRHGVARLALFGSVLRDDFGPDSDVDVLVEFPPGMIPSLLDLGGMLMELRDMLGREVDLKTPGFLSRYFRDQVVRDARTLYAA